MSPPEALVVTAPGKVMFAGEYAVLHGSDAVLVAVNRRGQAFDGEPVASGLFDTLEGVLRNRGLKEAADRLGHIKVETGAFYDSSGEKLGIGSSAAAVVVASGFALWEGAPPPLDLLLEVARQAHGDFQSQKGGRGSGVDVVCSALGGAVTATASGRYQRLTLPENFYWALVWTGKGANSPDLISQVDMFAQGDRVLASRLFSELADVAALFRKACEGSHGTEAVAALDRGALALDALGQAAKVELTLPVHKSLRAVAARFGGTAKPVGAGGGDVCLCAFSSQSALAEFKEEVSNASFVALAEEPLGVQWSTSTVLP